VEEWLKTVVSRIAAGKLLAPAYFAAVDADAALNARDRDKAFETAWLRLFEENKRNKRGQSPVSGEGLTT
jgi:hypothetical protein